jgi:hypothetical protein
MRDHGVELVGERFELVPGLDGDALAKVAAAEACGTGPQLRTWRMQR